MAKKESKELVKVEPARALSPLDEAERWFEEIFRRPSWWPRLRFPEMEQLAPSVDIFEEGDSVVVKAELPGMKKEEVEISLSDDIITISGEKKKEEKVEKKDYYRLERSYGSFTRSFRLPGEVKTENAKAEFKDGLLVIRIPKREEAKRKQKKIPIE